MKPQQKKPDAGAKHGGKEADGSPRGNGALERERRAKKVKGRATYIGRREKWGEERNRKKKWKAKLT